MEPLLQLLDVILLLLMVTFPPPARSPSSARPQVMFALASMVMLV